MGGWKCCKILKIPQKFLQLESLLFCKTGTRGLGKNEVDMVHLVIVSALLCFFFRKIRESRKLARVHMSEENRNFIESILKTQCHFDASEPSEKSVVKNDETNHIVQSLINYGFDEDDARLATWKTSGFELGGLLFAWLRGRNSTHRTTSSSGKRVSEEVSNHTGPHHANVHTRPKTSHLDVEWQKIALPISAAIKCGNRK